MEKNEKDKMNLEVMRDLLEENESMDQYRRLIMQYECAMLEVKTKLDVLNSELSLQHSRNPFETIKCRIKSAESILEKMERNGIPLTVENVEKNLNDIAGIRVICSFPDDIYMLADCLLEQDDIKLIAKKDYIKNPKPNGYRSLHLILEIPIFLTDEKKPMRVEVQFRTIAMDFWASLEHQLRYKKDFDFTEDMAKELQDCAELSAKLDSRMDSLRERVEAVNTYEVI